MRNFTEHLKCVFLSALLFASGPLFAQQTTVKGSVVEMTGNRWVPIVGATMLVEGTTRVAVSDANGEYSLQVAEGETVNVSFIGYNSAVIPASRLMADPTVVLQQSAEQLDDVVVVGYGAVKRATLTGAVSAVKGSEVVKTKNENTVNMLTGKVSGLRIVQNSSEPGQFKSDIDLRGFGTPTVVIDGVIRDNIARLDPGDIESISVLKDASAAIYGLKAGKGVIVITTKRGTKGQSEITYNGEMTLQTPSNFPDMVSAVDWMTLFNERNMHETGLTAPAIRYSDEEIASWGNGGTNTSTNWRKEVFRNVAPQMRHTINATGGSDRMTYYASFGYQNQESFLQSDAINYNKFSLRSNVSSNITDNLRLDLNLSGFMDTRNGTPHGSYDIVRATWIMRPMDGVWYDRDKRMYSEPDNNTIINPVAAMNDIAGHNTYTSKWFQSSATLTWDLPWVEGLSLKGLYSYDFIMNDNKEYLSSYTLYDPGYATNGASTTWNTRENKPYQVGRFYYVKNHSLWNASLNYVRSFGKHNVSAMALLESTYKEGDNFRGRRQATLPVDEVFAGDPDDQVFEQDSGAGALYEYAYNSFVSRLAYDYDNRYMIEATMRYEGSSKFYKDMKWVAFPSVSAAWNVAGENFWKNSRLSFIDRFKIRGSYGVMGDDGNMTYQWMTGYTYPSGGYLFYDGSSQKWVTGSQDKGVPNLNLTWQDITMANIGVDLEAWGGLLGVSFDLFHRQTEGIPERRTGTVPGFTGVQLPAVNLNSTRNRGFEIEVSHRHHIGEFYYQVAGNLSYTRERRLYHETSRNQGNSYTNWRNNSNDRNTGIWWGYGDNGRITSWDEIYHNPVFIASNTIIGDYEYEDWNGDGMIDGLDEHPLANNSTIPLINYGLTVSGSWRGIDFSMLWQGTSSRYTAYSEILYSPLVWGNAGTLSQFMDRWHPADPKANPYDPSTNWVGGNYAYTGSLPNVNSMFNMQNAAYVRLKSLEIGYTFPQHWMEKIGVKGLRVYANAYNVLTFTNLKYLDPEFPSSSYGYNYPLNKTYTLGVNLKF